MKKLDLHIHTKRTISDVANFEFSINKLIEYAKEMKLDGIAITNHNQFDISQYKEIKDKLSGVCEVLPGIEINVGINGMGHLLCIASQDSVEEFAEQCSLVQEKISDIADKISLQELRKIFTDFNRYLLIPHYEKNPCVEKEILVELKEHILCGEVGSVKKFLYCQRNPSALVPVYFSDYRPMEDDKELPIRQTFFDIDEISVQAIRKALISRKHVSLTEKEGSKQFYILPNLKISTGLNVVIGERSSGKTYTLDEINKFHKNIKYIKQFELIEPNPEQAAKEFADNIKQKRSSIADDYLKEFSSVVAEIKEIDIDTDEKNIEKYLTSLIKYAEEQDRVDAFAKCRMFSETKFTKKNFKFIDELIEATDKLISANQYRDVIDKHISVEVLKNLYRELVDRAIEEKKRSLEEEWINKLIDKIKQSLRIRSASNEIEEIDFFEIQMKRNKVVAFNELVSVLKNNQIINQYEKGSFLVRVRKGKFNGPKELKRFSGKANVRFSDIYDDYCENPYKYLLGLKEMSGISEVDYYKYFVNIEYNILNKYGAEISGGERAEFKLLNAIEDANRYDLLLIDEPESSFDNLFLKEKVNSLIKEISKNMPVILVTHNNTVGASIKPDYIIYTKRIIENEQAKYERYCGLPSSKVLRSSQEKEIRNYEVLLNCLEAGKESYEERKRDYEILDD